MNGPFLLPEQWLLLHYLFKQSSKKKNNEQFIPDREQKFFDITQEGTSFPK